MCKILCCSSAVLLAVLMTVEAFAAPPVNKNPPDRGPAFNRAVKQTPGNASTNIGKSNPAENRKQAPRAQGTADYTGPHHGYKSHIKPFTPAWYANHPHAWWAAHPYRRAGAVTWYGLSRWVGIDAAPVLYDYSTDGSEEMIVYAEEDSGEKNPFEPEYNLEADETEETKSEWYPLGMFSLIPPGNTDGIAMLQLAIGKDGSIRGTYQDVLTDGVYPLRGSLDRKTQKASWHLDANKAVVYETGLQNLTEPTTALMVRFGDEKRQKWTMRRVEADQSAPRIDGE